MATKPIGRGQRAVAQGALIPADSIVKAPVKLAMRPRPKLDSRLSPVAMDARVGFSQVTRVGMCCPRLLPEARRRAGPAGGRMPARQPPADGEAGGFNAVQRFLTTTFAATLSCKAFACGAVTGIEATLSAWEPTCYGESTVARAMVVRGVDAV
jgi:hypothetical protein